MKRKVKVIEEYDLTEMSFDAALDLAFRIADQQYRSRHDGKNLTYGIIAQTIGKSESTVKQYFKNPKYSPSPRVLPILNKALGNHILTEWLCLHDEGMYIQVAAETCEDLNMTSQINKVQEASSSVISAFMEATKDGRVTEDEARLIVKRLRDDIKNAEQAIMCAEKRYTAKRSR